MTLMRMSEGQLELLHRMAIKHQEIAEEEPAYPQAAAYAQMSVAASNLVIIEMLARLHDRQFLVST